nr:KilA-N domain-containing protein [Crocosphaera watsonii]
MDKTNNLVSLNQLWKAANSPKGKDPRNWLELDQSAQFIYALEVKLNVVKDNILKTQRGRGGGTWACFEIALEYAAYLSPEMRVLIAQWIAQYRKDEFLSELLKNTVTLEITDQSGFIYLVKAGDENIYKIGCSKSPIKRLSSLQSSNHQDLRVVHRVFP